MEHSSVDIMAAMFAAVFVVSSLCQWLAWRVKLPAIVFLLLAGIIAGPVLQLVSPDAILGDLLFPFVALSVSVILFEGSLTLNYREIGGLQRVVRNLVSVGMLTTWVITTLLTRYILGLSWELSLLFGAISVVTGPTVIAPMLRTVRPTQAVSNILRWEGIVIDPIGASLAVLVYEFIVAGGGQRALGHTLIIFGLIVLVGFVIGILGGYGFGLLLRHHLLPEYLHNVTALGLVFGSFALSNLIQPESGLVTVTVMGIWLANMPNVDMEEILDFKESLSLLLISLLFIILASRLDFADFTALGWPALLVLLGIQFVARPFNVLLSSAGSNLTWPERHLLAWIAPRGIVAAAVSALFAMQLEQAGFVDAEKIVPLIFMVIIGTVLFQSATARPLAMWLGVAEPEPRGYLIVGANPLARAIGLALQKSGFRVRLADSNWEYTSKARMEGMPTYFGNPISEHADRHLDMVGLGRMLALSPQEELNMGAAMYYRIDLGVENIFRVQNSKPKEDTGKKAVKHRRGTILFGENVTYASLDAMLDHGAEIHSTKLSESFTFKEWREQNGNAAVALFAMDVRKNLRLFSIDNRFEPAPGWQIFSLVLPDSHFK
ncbi:MAG: sodium:proton antiporter [Desulfuromonadaceae bacterium]|nr:sodium:proton antiporter [Desulfuromonadaceae bacterium]